MLSTGHRSTVSLAPQGLSSSHIPLRVPTSKRGYASKLTTQAGKGRQVDKKPSKTRVDKKDGKGKMERVERRGNTEKLQAKETKPVKAPLKVSKKPPSKVPEKPSVTALQKVSQENGADEKKQLSIDVEQLVNALKNTKSKWDSIENKPQIALYGGGTILGACLTALVISAVNQVPLVPKLLEFTGLGYSAWFIYRNLLFKEAREQFLEDVDDVRARIASK